MREELNLASAAYHAAALPLCYAPSELRLCPVQELNLTLRLFKPALVTSRASGAKAGLASRRHVFLFNFQRARAERPPRWVSGESNPVRSGKNRVLGHQSF